MSLLHVFSAIQSGQAGRRCHLQDGWGGKVHRHQCVPHVGAEEGEGGTVVEHVLAGEEEGRGQEVLRGGHQDVTVLRRAQVVLHLEGGEGGRERKGGGAREGGGVGMRERERKDENKTGGRPLPP